MKRIIWLFFIASVPGILGQIDMNGKAFSFYERLTNYVHLIPATNHFTDFTICLKSCKNLTENMLEVNLVNRDDYAEFLVSFSPDPDMKTGANVYILYKKSDKRVNFAVSKMWIDICVTFNFSTGKLVLLLNGKEYRRLQLGGATGSYLRAASVILGQTNYGQSNTDVAQITNVNMWSSALTARDIQRFMEQKSGGDIINWRSLVYTSDYAVSIEEPRCLALNRL